MMAVEEEDLLFIFLNLSPCLCKQSRAVEGSRVLHRGMSGMATKRGGGEMCVCVGLERAE